MAAADDDERSAKVDAKHLLNAMNGHLLGRATLIGRYRNKAVRTEPKPKTPAPK